MSFRNRNSKFVARQTAGFNQACLKPEVPEALVSSNTCASCRYLDDEPFDSGPCKNCVDYRHWKAV